MDDSFLIHNSQHSENTSETALKKPELMHVSILFSIGMALFLFFPVIFKTLKLNLYLKGLVTTLSKVTGVPRNTMSFYFSGIISEVILVLLPSILILIYFRYDIRNVLRLKKVSFLNLFIVFWIIVFSLPAVGALNLLNLWLVKLIFGSVSTINIPQATNVMSLFLSILVIGGSAGICEETMFRGVILRGFERFGAARSIIFTALLFGLMHRDMERLFGTMALGGLIGFLVYKSNSIYSGMFAHFTNNSIAVFIGYIYSKLDKVKASSLSKITNEQMIIGYVFWGIIGIFCTAALIALIYAFIQNTNGKTVALIRERNIIKKGLVWIIPGLLMVAFIYLVQGTNLSGIKIPALEGIIKFLGL